MRAHQKKIVWNVNVTEEIELGDVEGKFTIVKAG